MISFECTLEKGQSIQIFTHIFKKKIIGWLPISIDGYSLILCIDSHQPVGAVRLARHRQEAQRWLRLHGQVARQLRGQARHLQAPGGRLPEARRPAAVARQRLRQSQRDRLRQGSPLRRRRWLARPAAVGRAVDGRQFVVCERSRRRRRGRTRRSRAVSAPKTPFSLSL